jgi:uncharacterized damage-inducible protein DinB
VAKPSLARPSILEEALEAWEDARTGVIAELRNIPDRRIDFRPSPESRSVAELTAHIIESGLMMSGELTRPDGSFRRQPFAGFIEEYAGQVRRARTRRALLDLLRTTHAQGARRIRDAGELFMLQVITRFDGQLGTRLAWMHHAIAHEEYHRGQLALCARLLGRVPALTRLIQGG